MGVLCNGSRATRVCLGGAAPALVEVENFWDQYKQVGRCAIDVSHSVGFRDEAQRFHFVERSSDLQMVRCTDNEHV